MKNVLIVIDRDGTLIYDNKLHIGHTKDWKKKIKILPYVKKGIKLLRKELPQARLYIISNQSGVAIKNFKLLTEKKSNEVCEYISNKLKLDGYNICGHVKDDYVKRRPKYKFIKKLVCNCSCIKPNTGMITSILKKLNWDPKETTIYILGDRYIDVKTALNINGTGILIPFKNELKELNKFKKYIKNKKNTYIAKHFLDACKKITSSF